MSTRNIIALCLIIASLICLYPGLTQDMMTLKISKKLPILGTRTLLETTQSILQTIENLFAKKNYLVAWLILIFSVVIPLLKAGLLLLVLCLRDFAGRSQILSFISIIGKWSMADVFVVSIFMAFLVTQSNDAVAAWLHDGYYYFTAYCLLSILGTQLICLDTKQAQTPPS